VTAIGTVAIIGASIAGVRAAETLRSDGFDGRVVLIGDEPRLPYDRPPLSKQVLTGHLAPGDTTLHPAEFYDERAIDLFLGRRATALRPWASTVELDDGSSIRAERVLLATGGRPRRLTVDGAHLAGVHTLRTADDASAVAESLVAADSVVVVGAGFIGAEVAASARQVGCRVTCIEAAALPLRRVLGEEIAQRLADEHRQRGVDLRTGTEVAQILGEGRVQAVLTSDGARLPADLVVVGVGIDPSVELARAIGLACGNGIHVDQWAATPNPAVYAAGDVANIPSATLGRRVRHEQWQHAFDHGAVAARAMLGRRTPSADIPWFWSDQYDLTLQLAGYPELGSEIVWRGEPDSDRFCAFYVRGGMLLWMVKG